MRAILFSTQKIMALVLGSIAIVLFTQGYSFRLVLKHINPKSARTRWLPHRFAIGFKVND
jgi:hypothetical protein